MRSKNHKRVRENASISGQERKSLLQVSRERERVDAAVKARWARASGSSTASPASEPKDNAQGSSSEAIEYAKESEDPSKDNED
jgi:hypothetical protein